MGKKSPSTTSMRRGNVRSVPKATELTIGSCTVAVYLPGGRSAGKQAEVAISSRAESLSKQYRIPLERIIPILLKTVAPIQTDEIEYSFDIEKVLRHIPTTQALRLLDNPDNMRDLFIRSSILSDCVTRHNMICDFDTMHTLTLRYRDHVERNRRSLIETGLPDSQFGSCLYLDKNVTNLFFTKLPSKVKVERNAAGHAYYSYEWPASWVGFARWWEGPMRNEFRRVGLPEYQWRNETPASVPYADAAHIPFMLKSTARRIEDDRETLLSLKLGVLSELADSVKSRDWSSFWVRVAPLWKSTFTLQDLRFYWELESVYELMTYVERGRKESWTSGFVVDRFPGSIQQLLRVVQYFERAIGTGVPDAVRRELGDLFDVARQSGQLDPEEQYFKLVAQKGQKVVDASVDRLREFMSEFDSPVEKSLSAKTIASLKSVDFDETVTKRIRTPKSKKQLVEAQLDLASASPSAALQHRIALAQTRFRFSADFRTVKWRPSLDAPWDEFTFTKKRADIVKYLWECFGKGFERVTEATIKSGVCPTRPSRFRMRDEFKNHEAFGSLITKHGDATYSLNLMTEEHEDRSFGISG